MIKNILYVEDGSVDVDELIDSLGEETKIIIYRQGANPPILEQPKEPIKNEVDCYAERLRKAMNLAKSILDSAWHMKMTKQVRDKIEQAYTELD